MKRNRCSGLEVTMLDDRINPTTFSLSGGVLTILGTMNDDRILVQQFANGTAQVNGQLVPGGRVSSIDISAGAGNDYIDLVNVTASSLIHGGRGNDTIYGGSGRDLIYGGKDNDTINGRVGSDVIYGGEGNDILNGGQGDDRLYGEAGNDVLSGGRGRDDLSGGPGTDFFVVTDLVEDYLIDFNRTEDILVLVPGQ